MYVRTKKVAKTQHQVVQLAESYREDGKTKQRVLRHIGTAHTPAELEQLKQLANSIKTELEHKQLADQQQEVPQSFARQLGSITPLAESTKVDLLDIEEEGRYILGVHDIYGSIYDLLNFTNLFSRPQQRIKAAEILREVVLARIAKPISKRATVELLEKHFGIQLNLDNVYQMMDKIDDLFCERIQRQALAATLNLTGEKLKILFYDATTLYFESFTEDDLKQNGYSKDMKFNQPQILLALFVTEKGLPVGYEVFPGATFEGHTLVAALEKLKARYNIKEVTFVADRGMLSAANLEFLDKNKLNYIVGSRIRSLKKVLQQEILNWAGSLKKEIDEIRHQITIDDKRRLILSYRADRAKKDQADRDKSIQKLQARLKRSKNPKQLIARYGFQKYITVIGDAKLQIDEDRLNAESAWDGITGVITNHPALTEQEILEQYSGLWQVEDSFRITKHDLRIRPIYHWTPNRIRAHIAISFMAFTCVRYLEYRISAQYKKLSPEQIRTALLEVQASIIKDKQSGEKYLIPSSINPMAKQIYRVLAIKTPKGVMKIQ